MEPETWALVVLLVLVVTAGVVGVIVVAVRRIDYQKAQLKMLWKRVADLEAQRRAARAAASAEERKEPVRPPAVAETPLLFRKPPEKYSAYWHITHPETVPPACEEMPAGAESPAVPAAVADSTALAPLPAPPWREPVSGPLRWDRDTPTVDDWEELLGTRVFVWLAAAALALAGIWLIKYWANHGMFTAARRLLAGVVLGGLWLGLGQWRTARNPLIAIGFSGAGIVTLFGCFLTTANLTPEVLPPPWALACVAATAVLAVLLALKQGPLVAVVGLAGGFLTPALMHTVHQDVPILFTALLVVEGALLWMARRRGWTLLATAGVVGGMMWVAVWLGEAAVNTQLPDAVQGMTLGMFLLGLVTMVLLGTVGAPSEKRWQGGAVATRTLALGTAVLGLLLTGVLVGLAEFRDMEWVYLGILAAACVAVGRLRRDYEALAWAAAVVVLGLLASASISARQMVGPFALVPWTRRIGAFGILTTIGTFACLWRSAVPVRWAVCSCGAALAYLALAYGVLDTSPHLPHWGLIALLLAGIYTLGAIQIARRPSMATAQDTLSVFTWTAQILVAAAAGMMLQGAWLTAGWSLLAPLSIVVAHRTGQRGPREFAAWMLALVTLRLLAWPLVLTYPTGPTFFWNPLIWAYGIPIIAFAWAAWLLRNDSGILDRWFEAALQAAAFIWAALLVRRGFHPHDLEVGVVSLSEAGTVTLAWLALGGGLLVLGLELRRTALATGGRVIVIIALCMAMVAQGLLLVPETGFAANIQPAPFWNALVYAYGLPLILIFALAWYVQRRQEPELVAGATVVGLGLLWALATVEVRHLYHPASLLDRGVDFAEMGACLAVWLILAGIYWRWGRTTARAMGLMLLGLAIAAALFGPMLAVNPRWWPWDVGAPRIINDLLIVYGLPAACAGLLAWEAQRRRQRILARVCGLFALILVFSLLSLEIRQWFHGAHLNGADVRPLEMGVYSVVWVAYGVLLLVAGIVTRSVVLRGVSLAVMIASVGKVFLWDAANLHDLLRVGAFLGLAAALFGLAYLYQRFVFARPVGPHPEPLAAEGSSR